MLEFILPCFGKEKEIEIEISEALKLDDTFLPLLDQ